MPAGRLTAPTDGVAGLAVEDVDDSNSGQRLSHAFPAASDLPGRLTEPSPAGFAQEVVSAQKSRILHIKALWGEDRYHN